MDYLSGYLFYIIGNLGTFLWNSPSDTISQTHFDITDKNNIVNFESLDIHYQ